MCICLCSYFLLSYSDIFLVFIYLTNVYMVLLLNVVLLDSGYVIVKGYLWSFPLGVHSVWGKIKEGQPFKNGRKSMLERGNRMWNGPEVRKSLHVQRIEGPCGWCSANRGKGHVDWGWGSRARSYKTFLKVRKCQAITWSTVGSRVTMWLELPVDFFKDHFGSTMENGLEREA